MSDLGTIYRIERKKQMNSVTNIGVDNIKLAFISTYSGMTDLFVRVAGQKGIRPYIASATLDEAAEIAKKIESHTDVILSRGGTAEYIKNAVHIPVVSIPITSFDVVLTLHAVKGKFKEIAFFNYKENLYGIRNIEKIFDVTIREYTFTSAKEIENGLRDAQQKGIQAAIGGIIVERLAPQYSMRGILIECGEEAIDFSVSEAIRIATVRHTERSRAARIRGALDAIAEGIIVTDEHNLVTIFNPAAERIFRLAAPAVIGRPVQTVIPNTRMHNVFETGVPETAIVQVIHEGKIATNRNPIILDGQRIGVVSTFEDVTKIQQLEEQIRKQIHAKGFVAKNCFADILTISPLMTKVKKLAALYASTDGSVLIQGESGTGKELFAQSIHNESKRAKGPFIAVNCAAIPEHLLESELFGYEGGAFTGARKEGKQGLFELSHKGTIFLDEIGEIPQSLQARLLRVLQEKEIMRVGGDKIVPVDIRIISATNKDLEIKVQRGEFRDDLYYRLNVFNSQIPPLRERKEDLAVLAKRFLIREASAFNIDHAVQAIIPLLQSHDWPGNIRELQNVLERFALLAKQPDAAESWEEMLQNIMNVPKARKGSVTVSLAMDKGLKAALDDAEKIIIDTMMARHNQNPEAAAKALKVGRVTLWRKRKEKA